ncbi:MAG TPA: hypothetical protein VG713_11570 [Pirellulales bacterium]|nr:hypothetical protein [Pirellulales bacterium]
MSKIVSAQALIFAFLCLEARAAETADLRPTVEVGSTVCVDALLEVGGSLKAGNDGKQRLLPLTVAGKIRYTERFIATPPELVSLRRYDLAEATIKVDGKTERQLLRDDRQIVAARQRDDQAELFSPAGSLKREELELLDLPANSLLVNRLLPDRMVGVGDKWQHSDDLLAALLGIDAVSQSSVESRLAELDGTTARIELSGHVEGAVGGVTTSMDIKGAYRFNRSESRITTLSLVIDENRSVGHANPGADVAARLTLSITPCQKLAELEDAALERAALEPDPAVEQLEYISGDGQVAFLYDRRWHTMQQSSDTITLRLVDRGDLVAQCNFTQLPTSSQRPTLAKFQDDIRRSLDKSFRQFVHASERTATDGTRYFKVVVDGVVADLPIQWNYYHVAAPGGQQAACAFTFEEQLASRLGDLDRRLIESMHFADAKLNAERPAERR